MTSSKFNNVRIGAISVSVPSDFRHIENEIDPSGNNKDQIKKLQKTMGFKKRHVVPNQVTTLDLCSVALQDLITNFDLDIKTIDCILFVTQKPDYIHPGNAHIIHNQFNFSTTCGALDINLGCSGYVYGLWLASSMVQSSACKRILLLAGDVPSKTNSNNTINKNLFGDAGSATIIEYSKLDQPSFFTIGANGEGFDKLIIPAGGDRLPTTNKILNTVAIDNDKGKWLLTDCFMDGVEVFNFTISTVPNNILECLKFAKKEASDIYYAFFHQANKLIIDSVANISGFKSNQYSTDTFSNFGNQSVASIPCDIAFHSNKNLIANNKLLLLCGFGIGLSFATAVLTLENAYISKIIYKNFSNYYNPESTIPFWINKIKGSMK